MTTTTDPTPNHISQLGAITPAKPSASDTAPTPTDSKPAAAFNSTPFLRKLSGNPSAKKSLKHVHMDPALKEELEESELIDVPGLVEHLFPTSAFPVPLEEIEKAVYQKHWSNGAWINFDPSNPTANTASSSASTSTAAPGTRETALSNFFNNLVQTILCTVGKCIRKFNQPKRKWDSKSQKPLREGPNAKRKPDVCLSEDGKTLTWKTVLVTLEHKSNASEHTAALLQLINSAYMIFSTQDERRFIIGVSVCASDIRVYVFDRSGVVGSTKFKFDSSKSLLVRLVAGLALFDTSGIGLDATIRHGPGGARYVTVDKVEYQIIKSLFITDSIRGRGTVCWHARRGEVDYVIKDTWTDVSRIQTEAEILTAAGKTQGVSELIAHEIVEIEGRQDSTANIRSIIGDLEEYSRKAWYENIEVRVHRRLVTTPLAEPLTSFRSKKELLQVLIGAIEAHRRLVEKHILHRDISINNVMIQRRQASQIPPAQETTSGIALSGSSPPTNEETEENEFVRGVLIDLDYALITQDKDGKKFERTSDPTGHRTGTLPFMATEILMGLPPGKEHEAHHDLESFFYIFLWLALNYAGPCDVERQDMDIETEDPFKGWLEAKSIRQLGINKYGSMVNPEDYFQMAVTDKCTLYFKDLVPCILELRRTLFSGNRADRATLTHQHLIDILQKPLAWLPDVDNWSCKDDEAGYGPVGKRKFDDIPEEEDEDQAEQDAQCSPSVRKRARTSVAQRDKASIRRSTRQSCPNPRYK